MPTRKVIITVTNQKVGDYEARSYPHDDINNNGKIELYKVPVYKITVSGKNAAGNHVTIDHIAPRFMPYYNNPKAPDPHYKTLGWVNSGLSVGRTITVPRYKRNYEVQNRYSPGRGAIVMKGAFYIHAGPASLADYSFGSAGCIEIIGNYEVFKQNIKSLSGLGSPSPDNAIETLVKERNLVVIIESAVVPNIRALFTREE